MVDGGYGARWLNNMTVVDNRIYLSESQSCKPYWLTNLDGSDNLDLIRQSRAYISPWKIPERDFLQGRQIFVLTTDGVTQQIYRYDVHVPLSGATDPARKHTNNCYVTLMHYHNGKLLVSANYWPGNGMAVPWKFALDC